MMWWKVFIGLSLWLAVSLIIGHLFGRWVTKHYPDAVREE